MSDDISQLFRKIRDAGEEAIQLAQIERKTDKELNEMPLIGQIFE